MVSCGLCKRNQREEFVALRHGGEYVRLLLCGYFCSVEDFSTYENAVQLIGCVHHLYRERFSALSTQEILRVEGVTSRD